MADKITRRDFLNGVQLTALTVVGGSITPLSALADRHGGSFALPPDYYPPQKTGLRGSHDGSWEVMHQRVAGESFAASAVEDSYDLVVVGGGISGLSSAFFYKEHHPNAKILILDNHDDFGGHAKRNEFDMDGETRIGYGGTEAIDTPSHYSDAAKELLYKIGIRTEPFYDYFDQEAYSRRGMSKSIFFDADRFGTNKLVGGFGQKSWQEFAAETPMSEKAKADFIRVFTQQKDYLPGKSFEEKYEILRKTSYEDFLRHYCKVDEEVIAIYKRWGMSFWCVGIDEVPVTAIQDYDGGMPGVEATLPRTGYRNDEPYIFHFPDGNASVARLIVRALKPKALPGKTMEDSVLARLHYDQLDREGDRVNIRLNATVVAVQHTDDGKRAHVTYVRDNTTHKIRAKKVVMACYNMAIPYLCPEMGDQQKADLAYGVKVPLVYTKILLRNWQAFDQLKTDFIYYPNGFYKQAELAYPVSIGGYKLSDTPDKPMVLHMCHSPWVPDVQGKDQWRVGRQQILTTPFEIFEGHAVNQLTDALSHAGFDAAKDISAITVNRWPHGYAYAGDAMWEPDYASEEDKPWVRGRKPFGHIHIANSDAGAKADTNAAITQAHRAVREIIAGG